LSELISQDLRWADDVFEPHGVTAMMERACSNPGRSIFHLLRIVSFAAGCRLRRESGKAQVRAIDAVTVSISRPAGVPGRVHAAVSSRDVH
jgi:hypothetical protein